jgi:hypothetical protein
LPGQAKTTMFYYINKQNEKRILQKNGKQISDTKFNKILGAEKFEGLSCFYFPYGKTIGSDFEGISGNIDFSIIFPTFFFSEDL